MRSAQAILVDERGRTKDKGLIGGESLEAHYRRETSNKIRFNIIWVEHSKLSKISTMEFQLHSLNIECWNQLCFVVILLPAGR
jgi:hypothetical protein